jgi:hypothetical protein
MLRRGGPIQNDGAVVKRLQVLVEIDVDQRRVGQFVAQHFEDQPFTLRVEGIGGLFHEDPRRALEENPRKYKPLLGAQGQHLLPVALFVHARGEPGQAGAFEGVADGRGGEKIRVQRVAERFAQGALGQEGTLGYKHDASFGRQGHPPAAPGPKSSDHLEEASRHSGIARDHHPLTAADVRAETIE